MFRPLKLFSVCLLGGLTALSSSSVPSQSRMGASSVAESAVPAPSAADEDEDWYEPKEDHFKGVYQGDAANMAKQPWNDYFGWVKSFYRGNFIDSGWTKRCKDLVSRVQNSERQIALRKKLNLLGRIIAAEWAKANDGRKVDNTKLLAWGSRLVEAKKKDSGEGETIQKEIELIAKEAGAGI